MNGDCLFSSAYLPPISYVAAMLPYSSVVIEAKETFPKQTYRNRARIMTAQGVRSLIVPTIRHNHSRTDEVAIDYRENWPLVHFRTLTAAYAASPYWDYYADGLWALLGQRYDRLIDLNMAVTRWLLDKLQIRVQLSCSMDFDPVMGLPNDFRFRFSPKGQPAAMPPYYQVFAASQPFAPDLTTLDLLVNLGPEARAYLNNVGGEKKDLEV